MIITAATKAALKVAALSGFTCTAVSVPVAIVADRHHTAVAERRHAAVVRKNRATRHRAPAKSRIDTCTTAPPVVQLATTSPPTTTDTDDVREVLRRIEGVRHEPRWGNDVRLTPEEPPFEPGTVPPLGPLPGTIVAPVDTPVEVPAVPAIPEPSTWAMWVSGVLAVGVLLRRRRGPRS